MKLRSSFNAILSLMLSLIILLPSLSSCSNDSTDPPGQTEESTEIDIFKDGISSYVLILSKTQSSTYRSALDCLQNAFEDVFGSTLACASEQVYQESYAQSGKLIFFGDLNIQHPAIDSARALSGMGGFGFATDGSCISFYATDDYRLYDLAELFARKYVKSSDGSLSIDKDMTLTRSFTEYNNATHEKYCEFTLPVLTVDVDGKKPVTSKEIYLPASVSLSNTYNEYTLNGVSAGIRGRGNGSWKYSEKKKPYKLKFDEKINLLGVGRGSSRDWVLLANPFDYTQLRNSIAFTLALEIFDGIDYCTDYQFAHLVLSGQYQGVYLICDQMENSSHKMDADEDPDSVSGSDYFIELDSYASLDGTYRLNLDYFSLEGKNWLIKSDYNTPDRCEYVRKRMERLMEAIKAGNESLVRKLIDMDSFVDMYLLQEYTKNTDVGWSSFYMVLRADGTLELTAPWDIDLSAGSDVRIDNGSWEGMHAGSTASPAHANPLFYLLIEQDFFYNAVCQRWAEVSYKAEQVVLEHIEYYSNRYGEEFALDIFSHYPQYSTHNFSTSTEGEGIYNDNIDHLLNWYVNRTKWMSSYYKTR